MWSVPFAFLANLLFCLHFQATELCSYFKALGAANVDDESSSEGDLANIVAVADLCFRVSYIIIFYIFCMQRYKQKF